MTPSEAIEVVGRLIAAFPNGNPQSGKGYIGALAAVLADYPRYVATRCCDPRTGVARETRFLPTVADIVAWCERETESLRFPVDREDDELAYLQRAKAREAEALAIEAARTKRLTYDELKAKHGGSWLPANTADENARPMTLEEISEKYGVPIEQVRALPSVKEQQWKTAAYFSKSIVDALAPDVEPAAPTTPQR